MTWVRILLITVILWISFIVFGTAKEPLKFLYDVEGLYRTIIEGGIPDTAVLPIPREFADKGFSFRITPALYIGSIVQEKIPRDRYTKPLNAYENFYTYERTPPFMTMSFDFLAGSFRFHVDYPLKREYLLFNLRDESNLPVTDRYPHISVDLNFPYNAYGVFQLGQQYIVIGRCKLRWGEALYPVALSDTSPYYDNLTYHLNAGDLKYTFHYISINPILTKSEWEEQEKVTGSDTPRLKTLVGHRLDVYISKNFRWGIGELTMIGGRVPDFHLISPFVIYHNNFESNTNTMGVLDFSWTPFSGLNIYGELALDDIIIPPSESFDSPTIYAYNLGLRIPFKILKGSFLLNLEYIKVTELMYGKHLPYLRFYNRITYLTNFPPSRHIVDYPTGFAYGPDAEMLVFLLSYFDEDTVANLEIFGLNKGPRDLHTPYEEDVDGEMKKVLGARFSVTWKNMGITLELVNGRWRSGVSWKMM